MAEQTEQKNYTEVAGYKIPKTDDPWRKWGSVALQGLGKGLQGFAQGINGNYAPASQGFADFGEGVSEALRKRRKDAEEAARQEEALAAQKQEQETIKPMETASVNPWYNYANKFLG